MTAFPRRITSTVSWFGNCIPVEVDGETLHSHLGVYLVRGRDKTLLVDTGIPRHWASFRTQLDIALEGSALDYIFPTHPEVPHASNLANLLDYFPAAMVVGDIRDYHLYFPNHVTRMAARAVGDVIDLGGSRFHFVSAVLRDLPSTLWGYEEATRVLFVADGFAFLHAGSPNPYADDPLHRPGECTLTSSDMLGGLDVRRGEFIVRAALYWSRYVDPEVLFRKIEELFQRYPTEIIGPAHGPVLTDLARTLPLAKLTHEKAYLSEN